MYRQILANFGSSLTHGVHLGNELGPTGRFRPCGGGARPEWWQRMSRGLSRRQAYSATRVRVAGVVRQDRIVVPALTGFGDQSPPAPGGLPRWAKVPRCDDLVVRDRQCGT